MDTILQGRAARFKMGWPDAYSEPFSGERQRIAIPRAILKRADILVFDEATSMLDTRTEAAVLENLRDVTAGRSTIVIARRLSSVVHADEIVVIEDDQVRERGRHAELLDKRGQYASLWRQLTCQALASIIGSEFSPHRETAWQQRQSPTSLRFRTTPESIPAWLGVASDQ